MIYKLNLLRVIRFLVWRLNIFIHDGSYSSEYPLIAFRLVVVLHAEVSSKDISRSSHGSVVHWALVLGSSDFVFQKDSINCNHGQRRMKLLGLHFDQVSASLGHLPGGTFEEQSMDENTVRKLVFSLLTSLFFDFFLFVAGFDLIRGVVVCDPGGDTHAVEGLALFAGGDLHDSCEETHGVEEVAEAG